MTRSRFLLALTGMVLLATPAPAAIVFSLDPGSPSGGNAAVYRAGPTGVVTNAALGLSALDNLNALSYGREAIGGGLWFSVDRIGIGLPGSAVHSESAPGSEEAAADVFQALPPAGSNLLIREEVSLGLVPGFFGDDIDALAWDEGDHIYFSIDALSESNLSNQANDIFVDNLSTLFASGEDHIGLDPLDELDALVLWDVVNPGVLDPGIDKALFSLSSFSASVGAYSAADILFTDFQKSFSIFATAAQLGLRSDDNIDALQTAVPEPSSLALFASCLAVFSVRRWMPSARRSRR